MKLYVSVLVIVIILCMFSKSGGSRRNQHGGTMNLHGWHQDAQCNYRLLNVYKTFNKANSLNQNTSDSWSVYMPCGYNKAEREYDKIKSISEDQKIFIIKGCDNLSRKDSLWNNLRLMYYDGASELMPDTFELRKKEDIDRLRRTYSRGKVYILKKNIQRQLGLKMTTSLQEILDGIQDGFVVAQEMLQDPLLVSGRKTNFRVYLLIVCKNGVKRGYLYNNGYVYYTPKPFKKNSMDYDSVITAGLSTGRKDDDFYSNHPLTIKQLERMMGADLCTKTGQLMKKVLSASSPNFCNTGHLRDRTTFQLFGCDIAYNNKLKPQLIEINKGPDLSSKTPLEEQIKNDQVANIFKIVGVPVKVPLRGHFKHIWTS